MKWKKLKPVAGSVACLTCGCGAHETLEMERTIAVGFGYAGATKDGEEVYKEPICAEDSKDEDFWKVQRIEDMAAKDPNHDWRIYFYAPLWEGIYQRQGKSHWVLVKKGQGFA